MCFNRSSFFLWLGPYTDILKSAHGARIIAIIQIHMMQISTEISGDLPYSSDGNCRRTTLIENEPEIVEKMLQKDDAYSIRSLPRFARRSKIRAKREPTFKCRYFNYFEFYKDISDSLSDKFTLTFLDTTFFEDG